MPQMGHYVLSCLTICMFVLLAWVAACMSSHPIDHTRAFRVDNDPTSRSDF